MHAQHAHARVHVHAHVHVHMHIYNREAQQTRLGDLSRDNSRPAWAFKCPHTLPRTLCPVAFGLSREQQTRLGTKIENYSRPAWEILPAHFAPHTLPWSCWWLDVSPRCPGAGGGWISPTQAPPFERHPRPAGDEGNATAKVAPSGLGQCQVVEPASAHTRPGSLASTTHTARGCSRGPKWGAS